MVDYLRITFCAEDVVESRLACWQLSHDFVELGDAWTETRKVRVFSSGPALKGSFGEAGCVAHFVRTALPPGLGCETTYDELWNMDETNQTWNRIDRQEFEARFSAPSVLDRLSPLTTLEQLADAPDGSTYTHWRPQFRSKDAQINNYLPTNVFNESVEGRILRRVEILKNGTALKNNPYIARREGFATVHFSDSLPDLRAYMPGGDDEDRPSDPEEFQRLYVAAIPKIDVYRYVEV